jgi:MFS family permease
MANGLFAGWRIVGVTLATQALQAGLLIYAFGTLAVPLATEFGVGRAQVMLASTFLGLTTNLLAPFAGRFVDRVPIRRLMLAAIACLFAGLCLVASARSLMQVWLAFALVLPIAQLLLGQMTSAALVSRWFVRLRGRALGVSALGTTIGGFIFPVLLATLSARYGWRTAVVVVAAGAVMVVAPLIAAFVVDRPQDRGMQPDGDAAPPASQAASAQASPPGFAEILRRRDFWLETVAVGFGLFAYLGTIANLAPHAISLGATPVQASLLMSLFAVSAVPGKLGFGAVADKLDLRVAMGLSLCLLSAAYLLMALVPGYAVLMGATVLLGLAGGGMLPVWGAMVAKSFTPASFGKAIGAMNLAMAPITMMNAPFAAFIYDQTGSYRNAFLAYLVVLAIAGLALKLLRFPAPAAPG